jgi:outer membrane protein assembly factor BamD (BamD/ComL family)
MPDPLDTVTAAQLFEEGQRLARQQDFIRAEQYFTAAIDRGHPEDQVMPHLIAACVRSSRLSAALRYAEPYVERHPDAWPLRLLVATIQMGLGEVRRARTELERIIADHPDQPVPHYMLAVLARDQLADHELAEMHFRRYLALEPEGEHAAEARAAIARPVALEGASAVGDASGARPVRLLGEGAPQRSPTVEAAQ